MRKTLALFFLSSFLLPASLAGQGLRFGDQSPVQRIAVVPGVAGNFVTAVAATVNFCAFPANAVPCTNKATTYTSVTLATPCSTATQITIAASNSCVGATDAYGNWGVWAAAGNYAYTYTIAGQSYGPFLATALTASTTTWANLPGGTNTSSAFLLGSTASLAPTGSGQNVSTASWLLPGGAGLFAPSVTPTFSQTGGSLGFATGFSVQITISNAIGESLPSQEFVGAVNGACISGSACSATITAPTLLSGQTYTVYSGNGSGTEKKQLASNACVNITGNCVIQVLGSGAAPPASNTSLAATPSPLGSTSSCAPFNTSMYIQDAAGNYQPQLAIDTTDSPVGYGKGNLVFCRPVIFNDSGKALGFTPNGVTIVHYISNATTTVSSQIQSFMNPGDTTSYAGQFLGLYDEIDLLGQAALTGGSPFGQVNSAAARFVSSYKPSGANTIGNGLALSATTFREVGGTDGSNTTGMIGTLSTAINLKNGNFCCSYSAYQGYAANAGTDATGTGYVYYAASPASVGSGRFGGGNYGFFSADFGTSINDWGFFSFSSDPASSSRNYFGGRITAPGGFTGAPQFTQITAVGIGESASVTCVTTCTATYIYSVVPKDANGGWGPAVNTLTTGAVAATTLNGSNFNRININSGTYGNPLIGLGITQWDVYRTSVTGGSPSTLGYIGTVQCILPGGCHLDDTGLAISAPTFADPVTPPSYNVSGAVSGFSYRTNSNCKVNSVSPAACGAAPAGSVVIPTTTTIYTVNSTVVTTNSEIQITWRTDATGLPSAPTCVVPTLTTLPVVSARVPGTSFTVTMTSTAGQTCFDYNITN